jgi:hypothetical protein
LLRINVDARSDPQVHRLMAMASQTGRMLYLKSLS